MTDVRERLSLPEAIARAAQALAQGRLQETEAICTAILRALPDQLDAVHLLGVLRGRQGRLTEALGLLDRTAELSQASAQVWSNRAYVLYLLGRHEEAAASSDKALAITPDLVDAFNNRGNALQALGRLQDALSDYDRAVGLNPRFAQAHNNRGLVLTKLGRSEEAVASFGQALAIAPKYVAALNNRAAALHPLRRYDQALADCDSALMIDPRHRDASINRGLALCELGRSEAALESFEAALAVDPNSIEALNGRGAALQQLARPEAALVSFKQVLACAPDDPHAFAGAADCALTICDWMQTAQFSAELPDRIARQTSVVAPFRLLAYTGDPVIQRQGAELWVRQTVAVELPMHREPPGGERMRIGYLSAQFMAHAGATLIAELIERHDRSRFDTIGLSISRDDRSPLRHRLVAAFDAFHDLTSLSDAAAAGLIRDLALDVLVDLTGHSHDARLGILAHRPAPVQVSWLGHAGTMGAPFIDYVIGDPIVTPFHDQGHFVEKIAQLPDCYLATDATRAIPENGPDRRACALPETGFVFCSFNNNYKITAPVFDRWMRLLTAVEGSALWLLRDNAAAEKNLCRAAAARGVDPARLVFAPRVPPGEHLARHRLADLFLDTLPFNAHVTAVDALWAGLPLVTCRGETFASRVAASALRAAGLGEMVTANLDEYERLALSIARAPATLQRLRQQLRDNRRTCALFDTDRFRAHLEGAYETMIGIARRGEPARSFAADAISA